MNSSEDFRSQIDAVDEQLVLLLAKRNQLVKHFWVHKRAMNVPFKDSSRENQVLERVKDLGVQNGLEGSKVVAIFTHIVGQDLSL